MFLILKECKKSDYEVSKKKFKKGNRIFDKIMLKRKRYTEGMAGSDKKKNKDSPKRVSFGDVKNEEAAFGKRKHSNSTKERITTQKQVKQKRQEKGGDKPMWR